ncbi:MAG: hypothetical protein KDB10_21815 [Acidimicrobiales bacterium]|nr:hypothetical protein [Acidimicrobiales bacterium]
MSPRPPSLGAFQAALAARLDALGPEGLRAVLERRAATLRPSEREAFLALFDPVAASVESAPVGANAAIEEDLAAFADAVARMPPSQRWQWRERWDDDEDEPLPAEGAVAEDLLVAIGERFLAGDVAWAADAYEQVFAVVQSTFDDDRDIDLGVDRALASEARNRLLWAIATTEPDPVAAGRRMAAGLELCDDATDGLTLDDLLVARPGGDPVADEVLRAFATALSVDLDLDLLPSWDRRRRLALAFEVGVRLDGVDTVVAGARSGTMPRLDTYRWLVSHLADTGDVERAVALGEEALADERRSYDVADLADEVARLALRIGRPESALAAQCRSWACRPTVICLERVLDAAEAAGRPGVPAVVDDHPSGSRFLQAAVHLLAGRFDEAIAPATGSEHLSSHDRYAADRLVIAAACQGAAGGPVRPAVCVAVHDAGRRAEMAGWFERDPSPDRPTATPLAERLLATLGAVNADPARLEMARRRVDHLAERVLGAKDRPAYETVAAMVVLLAQTAAAVEGAEAATVVDEYDHRYRRFPAFRGELRDARAAAGIPAA